MFIQVRAFESNIPLRHTKLSLSPLLISVDFGHQTGTQATTALQPHVSSAQIHRLAIILKFFVANFFNLVSDH